MLALGFGSWTGILIPSMLIRVIPPIDSGLLVTPLFLLWLYFFMASVKTFSLLLPSLLLVPASSALCVLIAGEVLVRGLWRFPLAGFQLELGLDLL